MNYYALIINFPSYISCLKNIIYFKLNGVRFGPHFRVFGKVGLNNYGEFIIGNKFVCSSGNMANPMGRNIRSYFRVAKGAKLSIGNNVGISSCVLWCAVSISIGNNTTIGADTIITDTDVHSLNPTLRVDSKTDSVNASKSPIIIKDNTFIF